MAARSRPLEIAPSFHAMPAHLIGRHLMESAPRPTRGVRPFCVSTTAHGAMVALAVWGTLEARPSTFVSPTERVAVVDLAAFAPAAAARAAAPPARKAERGFQVLAAPREVPTSISIPELKEPVTIAEDFSGEGVAGGVSSPIAIATLAVASSGLGEPIDGALADQPPFILPGQMGPAYPSGLRSSAPDGIVIVRFVIDTLGLVESPSLAVVESSHPLFLASVRTALDRLRFLPARFSGRPVRVRMEQRFEFHLAGR